MDYSSHSDAYVARDFVDGDYYEETEENHGSEEAQWSDQWSGESVKSRPARRANYSTRSGTEDDGFVPLRPSAAGSTGRIGGSVSNAHSRVSTAPVSAPPASAAPVSSKNESIANPSSLIANAGLVSGIAGGAVSGLALAAASEKLGLSAQDVAAVQNLLAASQQATVQSSMLSFGFYRYYFRVDNEYVIAKLRRLFLPFLTNDPSQWRRKLVSEGSDGLAADSHSGVLQSTNPDDRPLLGADAERRGANLGPYFAAEKDVNAPDGYIPLMAVMTYILTMGLLTGTRKAEVFSPQVLMKSASSAVGMLLFEVLLLKAGFWLISSSKVTVALLPSMVDCVCYAGYKLVFVALNLLFSCLIDSSLAYMAVSLLTGLIAALFMVQTLRPYFKIETTLMDASQLLASSSRSRMDESSKTYILFLLMVAVLQVLFIQLMGRHVA